MTVLIIVRSLSTHLRFFDRAIMAILARGHTVELMIYKRRERPEERAWVEALSRSEPRFSSSLGSPWHRDRWYEVSRRLRGAVDYLELLDSDLSDLEALVARNARRAPRWAIDGRRWASRVGAERLFTLVVRAVERVVPGSPWLTARLRDAPPDIVVVAPSFVAGSVDSRLIRSAREAGVKCCVAVATWDDLACKQRLALAADQTLVWNVALAEDAIARHRATADRISITGAHCFDRWFEHEPIRRETWCARIGIDPDRPYVLYVGGSLGRRTRAEHGATEAEWARRWVRAVRASPDPAVRNATIVIRPHPKAREDARVRREWDAVSFDGLRDVTVWPRGGTPMPVSEDARSDYFQSLYHSHAVVGLNSSAMIEAAIVGRPVLSVEPPEFASAQMGRAHFHYLSDPDRGLLHRSPDLDHHVVALADALRGSREDPRSRAFVEWFVRPGGMAKPAAEIFADAIEQAVGA